MTIRFHCIIPVLFCALPVAGQVTLTADSTKLLIGDQVGITLSVAVPPGAEWANQDVEIPDSLQSVEVLTSNTPSKEQGLARKAWRIAVFDTGDVIIPALPVVIRSARSDDTMYSNTLPLEVRGVVVDSTQLMPIKPIIREPLLFRDLLPWIAGILGVALIAAAYFFLKRRKKQMEERQPTVPERPPHEIAFDALDALESRKLWQKGAVKQYHSELSHILRTYLEKRFDILALESTTGEILAQLEDLDIHDALMDQCREMMRLEDLIKFAKATPPVEVHARFMAFVRQFVRDTMIREEESEMETDG